MQCTACTEERLILSKLAAGGGAVRPALALALFLTITWDFRRKCLDRLCNTSAQQIADVHVLSWHCALVSAVPLICHKVAAARAVCNCSVMHKCTHVLPTIQTDFHLDHHMRHSASNALRAASKPAWTEKADASKAHGKRWTGSHGGLWPAVAAISKLSRLTANCARHAHLSLSMTRVDPPCKSQQSCCTFSATCCK